MVKFKLYYDKDAEEEWLNQMCGQGYAVQSFFAGFYRFEKCEPFEYRYQIDLLNPSYGSYEEYCQFMEESGVTVVQRWFKWVFLRKPSSEGPFKLYSDTSSLIEHYSNIKGFFTAVFIMEVLCCLYELIVFIIFKNIIVGCCFVLMLFISGAILKNIWKCQWKIEQYKKEME